ncbi:MAG: hypothetical protein ACI3VZ_05740 [Faecousia sp.]
MKTVAKKTVMIHLEALPFFDELEPDFAKMIYLKFQENDGNRRDKSYGLGRVGFPRPEPAVAVQVVSVSSERSEVA